MQIIALFCDDAGTDEYGKLSIRGVLNELQASDFPARQERLVLVVVVEWDGAEHGRIPFRIDLLGPDDDPVFTVDGHTDVKQASEPGAPAKTQMIMPLENVLFVRPGRYRVRLTFGEQAHEGPSLYLKKVEAAG